MPESLKMADAREEHESAYDHSNVNRDQWVILLKVMLAAMASKEGLAYLCNHLNKAGNIGNPN